MMFPDVESNWGLIWNHFNWGLLLLFNSITMVWIGFKKEEPSPASLIMNNNNVTHMHTL